MIHQPFPIQFTAVFPPPLLARLLRRAPLEKTIIVFDLEDGVADPIDPAGTQALKAEARQRLIEFVSGGRLAESTRFGVRINNIRDDEYEKDIVCLGALSRFRKLNTVILPKTQNAEDLRRCKNDLARDRARWDHLVPIVETKTGLENLDSTLDFLQKSGSPHAVYGHYDYSLDAGAWPFVEGDSLEYWEWIAPIIRRIESYGVSHIHPPYMQIGNRDGFNDLMRRTALICSRPFGIVTVTADQSNQCLAFDASDPSIPPTLPRAAILSVEEKIKMARDTIESYEKARKHNVSFTADAAEGRFVPPHYYLAAKKFLAEID
jgi:citrate lyase beta subunit